MSEDKIKLEKIIKSNKLSNKLYNKSFSELTRSEPPLSNERVEDLYNSLFYRISKKGKNSHESIIKESRDYLYPQINKKLDDKIESLLEELNSKQEELTKITSPKPSNSEYPNGSFLTAGNADGQFQGMTTVYVMQDGLKRAISSEGLYKLIRKSLKVGGELYSELYFLSIKELNAIPDGVKIEYQWHMSMPEFAADYNPIYQRFPFDTIKLYCEGREANDSFDLISGNFYLEDDPEDGCSVTYIKNAFDDDPEPYSIETEYIGVGQLKTIEIAKDDNGLKGIPPEITKQVYEDYYDYNLDIQQTGTRLWGKDKKYKGVLLAEGRILRKRGSGGEEKFNTKTNQDIPTEITFDEMYGNVRKIYSNGCRQLDGSFEDCFGDLNQSGDLENKFNDPDFRYYKKAVSFSDQEIIASVGNIESDSGFFGFAGNIKLDHKRSLGDGKTFPIYGQPILRLKGTYVVYLKYTENTSGNSNNENSEKFRFHYFYNLDESSNASKKIFKIRDEDLPDHLFNKNHDVYKEQYGRILAYNAGLNSSNLFGGNSMINYGIFSFNQANPFRYGMVGNTRSRFNWEAIKTSKIAYIGLTHEPIKNNKTILPYYESNGGNYFNPPDEGSNYGLSGEVRTILDTNNSNTNYADTSDPEFCPFTKAQLEQFSLNSIPAGSNDNLPLGCTFQNCLDC